MKSIKKKNENIIILQEDNFFELVSIQKNICQYLFKYNFKYSEAVEKNLINVSIKIYKEFPNSQDSLFNNRSDKSEIVNNILHNFSKEKEIKDINSQLIIEEQQSDPTSFINNEILKGNKIDLSNIFKSKQIVYKKVSKLEKNPIYQTNNFEPLRRNDSVSDINISSIIKDNIDPSNKFKSTFVNLTKKSISGIKNTVSDVQNTNFHLMSSVINTNNVSSSEQLNLDSQVATIEYFDKKSVFVTKLIDIDVNKLNNLSEFFVCFELKDSNGIVVQRIIKNVLHGENVKLFLTPTKPLNVSYSKERIFGKNILNIKNDNKSSAVRIYRKFINSSSLLLDSDYTFVKKINLNIDTNIVIDNVNNGTDIIYRIIAEGEQGQLSSEFTNIVVPGIRHKDYKEKQLISCGIISKITEKGVECNVVSIPPGVISVLLLKRDLTIYDKNYSYVAHGSTNKESFIVNGSVNSGIFLDANVKSDHIYEYVYKLIYKNGSERIGGFHKVEYIPINKENSITVNMSNPKIINREFGQDVVFNINYKITDSSLSNIKKILDKNGLSSLYESEFLNEKDFLNKLVCFFIKRTDLITGENYHFRIFSGETFSDIDNQGQIKSFLKPNHSYRYSVYPLLRSPETIFKNNYKTKENDIGISISYLPLKYFHPLIGKTGATVTPESLQLNYAKIDFEFGMVGIFVEKDISLNSIETKISDAKVIKFSKFKNILSWRVIGNKSDIDHFLILINRLGQEDIVGKSHAIFDGDIVQYIDDLNKDDSGVAKYKIIPVLKNYKYGSYIYTNDIII